MVRWPSHIERGAESNTPVIGSDIFATMCDIIDIPLPSDRVIDGASMLPAFANQTIQRTKPLYWRTHISSPDSRVAVRIGDWKIVANVMLTEFQLFNLKDDSQEKINLAEKHPDKYAEMKETLLAIDTEVLADGPDWWKKPQPEDRPNRKKNKRE
jgi:arylsulfatase A-like enzyme